MIDAPYLMGIDTGTTYIKVGVYDVYGSQVILRRTPTPLISEKSGSAEFNPELIWEKIVYLTQQIPAPCRNKIKAISISSFAETVYPLDSNGMPVDNGIAWFDPRTRSQNKKVKASLDTTFIRKTTGLFPKHIYSLNKILWFRENKSHLYKKTKFWLDNAGYVIFKFTGRKVIDHSLACRTMMLDVWQHPHMDNVIKRPEGYCSSGKWRW